jgi:TolA-binding protein
MLLVAPFCGLDMHGCAIYLFSMVRRNEYFLILYASALLVMGPACGAKKAPEIPPPTPVKKQSPARVQPTAADLKAQQRHYDLGLRYYADENYEQAKKSFQQVIERGPDSSLGLKARENLLKTEQVLRTLKEMEQR